MKTMNTIKIITTVCWIVTAVAILGLAVWFLTGSVFGIRSGNNSNLSLGFNIGSFERLSGPYMPDQTHSIDTAGLNSININWVSDRINVTYYDGDEIKITEYAQRELRDNEKFGISTSGGTLTIRFRESDGLRNVNMPRKRLEVIVPLRLCDSLDKLTVNSVSGNIDIDGVSASTIKTDSTSGGINIANINVQSLSAYSTSGAITLASVHTESMNIDSLSGAIRLSESSAGTLRGSTTSGAVDVDGVYGNVTLKSLSGKVTLNNSASDSILAVDTTSGTLVMSGAFSRVNAKSLSGRISITSSRVPSSLKADTTSGSITITVPNEGTVSVRHSTTSGRFSNEVPVVMQNQNAQFDLSSLSGNIDILELR